MKMKEILTDIIIKLVIFQSADAMLSGGSKAAKLVKKAKLK